MRSSRNTGRGRWAARCGSDRSDRAYTELFRAGTNINLAHERVRSGNMTQTCWRRGGFLWQRMQALVLPYDPQRDRVMLVEQLRMGPVSTGGPGRSGNLNPSRVALIPAKAQRRSTSQAHEEAGCP